MMQRIQSRINTKNGLVFLIPIILILILIPLLQIAFNPLLLSEAGLPSPLIVYNSSHYPYSIKHPQSWHISELTQGDHGDLEVIGVIHPLVLNLLGPDLPSGKIATKEISDGTIEEVERWGRQRTDSCRDLEEGARKDITVSGLQGVIIEYRCLKTVDFFTKEEAYLQCIDYYVHKASLAYDLSFCAKQEQWAEVKPVFEEMIKSFTLR